MGSTIKFTYSVNWVETAMPFAQRFNRYLDHSFFEHQIHWFSIFNSFMMVVFLCGLVALILMRLLRNDYAKVGSMIVRCSCGRVTVASVAYSTCTKRRMWKTKALGRSRDGSSCMAMFSVSRSTYHCSALSLAPVRRPLVRVEGTTSLLMLGVWL